MQRLSQREYQLRANGLGSFRQKINIAKVDQKGKSLVEYSSLLGIARRVISLSRRDRPLFSQFIRMKDMQSFEAQLDNKNWLVSQSRHNNVWVMSDG